MKNKQNETNFRTYLPWAKGYRVAARREACKAEQRAWDASSFGYPVSTPMLSDRTCQISAYVESMERENNLMRFSWMKGKGNNGKVPEGEAMRDLGTLPVFIGVEVTLHQERIQHSECQAESEDSFLWTREGELFWIFWWWFGKLWSLDSLFIFFIVVIIDIVASSSHSLLMRCALC